MYTRLRTIGGGRSTTNPNASGTAITLEKNRKNKNAPRIFKEESGNLLSS